MQAPEWHQINANILALPVGNGRGKLAPGDWQNEKTNFKKKKLANYSLDLRVLNLNLSNRLQCLILREREREREREKKSRPFASRSVWLLFGLIDNKNRVGSDHTGAESNDAIRCPFHQHALRIL